MTAEAPLVLGRFLHFASCMTVFGVVAFSFAMTPSFRSPENSTKPLSFLLRFAAILALLSALLWFICVAASMTGDWQSAFVWPALKTVLSKTQFGQVWQWRLAFALALSIAALHSSPEKSVLMLALSFVLLESVALTGHAAMGLGASGVAHQIADAVHLLAGGFWIGSLAALVLVLRSPMKAESSMNLLRRFSTFGVIAVVLVIATGALNAVFIVREWGHFLGSAYGRTLLAKVLLVITMVALAILNRSLVMPRSVRGPEQAIGALRRNVLVETATGALAVLAASVLGTQSPPV